MKQYIDKSAIMAEIKRYKHKVDERLKIKGRTLAEDLKDLALQNLCGNLIHTLDTLEVKEIDFDLGSPNGDIGVKTIWDGDKVVSVSEPSNNLEEAAKKAGQKYFPDENNIWARPNYEAKAAEYAFKDGVNWQKKQMMKDAVYGLVCGNDDNSPAWIDLNLLNKPDVKVGEEIKLIIIKEE